MKTFRAVEQLGKAAGRRVQVWARGDVVDAVRADALLVVGEPAAPELALKLVGEHLDLGHLVIWCVEPHQPASDLVHEVSSLRVGPESLTPAAASIEVERRAMARSPRLHPAAEIRSNGAVLIEGGRPCLTTDAGAIGAVEDRPRGSFVLLGDDQLFCDTQIGHGANAEFFLSLLDDTVPPDRAMAREVVRGLSAGLDPAHWPPLQSVDLGEWAIVIAEVADALSHHHGDLTSEQALVDARAEVGVLGGAALRSLALMRSDGPRPCATLLRNLPFGSAALTPDAPGRPVSGRNVALALLVSLAVGEPVGYRQESGGAIVQELVPRWADRFRQLSTASAVELLKHTEQAFHRLRPFALGLHCIRADLSGLAATTLTSVPQAAADLSLADVTVLSEPRFRTSADESFVGSPGAGGERHLSPPLPVLAGDLDDPFVTFDLDLLLPLDAEARRSLERLHESIQAHNAEVFLERGDSLVVDNRIAVHGRRPFRPHFDGTDRWLLRTLMLGQLPHADDRTGRIIEVRYH